MVRPRKQFAVCIGIDGYPPGCGYGRLQFAGRDATAVAESLLGQCKFDRVLLMTDSNVPKETLGRIAGPRLEIGSDLSRDTIRNRIEAFFAQARGKDDVIVFYYAGHADARRKIAYLVPLDYHRETAQTKTIHLSEIFERLDTEPVYALNKLVILDACRSSPTDTDGQIMAEGFREACVRPGQRMTVITACDARESSRESTELGHGRFTWALIQALTGGEAYHEKESDLLVTHIHEHIAKVFEGNGWAGAGPGHQNPQLFAIGRPFALAHRAITKVEQARQFGSEDPNRDLDEARRLYLGNRLERAGSKYLRCLRLLETSPRDDFKKQRLRGQVLAQFSRALYRLGRATEAAAGLKLAESLTRDDPVVLEVRGYMADDRGEYDRAARDLEQAAARQATEGSVSAYLFFRLGMALYRLERYEPSATYFLKAVEASERFESTRDAVEHCRWAAQSFAAVGRLDVAEKMLRNVLRRLEELPGDNSRPEQAETRLALAEVLRDRGEYLAAINEARAALGILQNEDRTRPTDLVRSLRLVAGVYERLGNYAEAEARYMEALKLYQEPSDRQSTDYACLLNDLARVRLALGRLASANDLLQRVRAIIVESRGEQSSQYATLLNNIGLAHYKAGKSDEAVRLIREALAIQEKVRGGQDGTTASCLNNLALTLQAQGRSREALSTLERALAIRRKVLPPDHPDIAFTLTALAIVQLDRREYAAAKKSCDESLTIYRNSLPPDHPDIALSFYYLATAQYGLEEYPVAKVSIEQALAIYRKARPASLTDITDCLNGLGIVEQKLGDYVAAKASHEEALAIRRKTLSRDHPGIIRSLNNLGSLQLSAGDYAAAKTSYEEMLAIRRRTLPADHPDIALALYSLELAEYGLGDYPAAKASIEEALAIYRKARPPSHPDIADCLNDLGNLQEKTRDFAAARVSHEEALAMRRRVLAKDHPAIGQSLGNIGNVQRDLGEYAAAKASYQGALDVYRKARPPGHPDIAWTLDALGATQGDLREYAAAKASIEEALTILRKALPPGHPDIALVLNNLGLVQRDLRNLAEARASFEEALAIYRKALPIAHPDIARSLNRLGLANQDLGNFAAAEADFNEAIDIYEQARGLPNRGLTQAMHNLAALHHKKGDYAGALAVTKRAVELTRKSLEAGEPLPVYLDALNILAAAYLDAKNWLEAEKTARECLELRAQAQPDDWSRFLTMGMLGAALAGQNKYADAEPLLIQSYEGLKAQKQKVPPQNRKDIAVAVTRIVLLYEAWSRKEKADFWRAKLGSATDSESPKP
jgi:tetratricopeptide (TPR) repeat protein